MTIYVYLPNEAMDVWAPVDADHMGDDVYRIIDCRGEDQEVQFGKGKFVRCKLKKLSGNFGTAGDVLVAYEDVTN